MRQARRRGGSAGQGRPKPAGGPASCRPCFLPSLLMQRGIAVRRSTGLPKFNRRPTLRHATLPAVTRTRMCHDCGAKHGAAQFLRLQQLEKTEAVYPESHADSSEMR